MKNPLSKKQVESYIGSTARLNLWEGAVRSGKSFISLLKFINFLKNGPPGQVMVVGVSRDALQRNVVIELCSIMGMPMPTPKSSQMNIFNRIVHFVGANDERAQRRIQGSTLACAYVDEMTLIPQGFFKMLLSRLSVPGAQLFGTTNPDSPFHWLKTEFLSNQELDMKVFKFKLDDNPSLTDEYINNLKKEYTGLWYKRYINGEWVLAEGTVYDFFDEDEHVIDNPPGPAEYYVVGIDYGTSNPTAFTMFGYNKKYWPNVWLEREYYYDSKKFDRQKTDTETVEDLIKFIQSKIVRCIYVDPSAASFKVEMMRQGLGGVIDADNDVLNGIRYLGNILNNGTLKICRCCKNTIREFQTYRWDEKVSLKGQDKPIKEFDHCFVAGTKVTTEHGDVPIENIKIGTKVKTRGGWNKVVQRFQHKAKVEEFYILGKKIICTPSHKFFTLNGWKKALDLVTSDILFTEFRELPWLKTSNLMEGNTDVTQMLKDVLKKCILDAEMEIDFYIEIFGSTTMDQFQKDVIYITKTTIPSTMTLAISSAYQDQNIHLTTINLLQRFKKKIYESIVIKSEDLQKNGMEVQRELNGTENTLKYPSQKKNLIKKCANNAEKNISQQKNQIQNFVRITVSHNQEEIVTLIMRKEFVLSVIQNSSAISTSQQNTAPHPVPRKTIGKRNVYNLHVENEHEYFVDRILTANCLDSMRYGCFTHFPSVLTGSDTCTDMDKIYADVLGVQSDLPGFFSDQNNFNENHPQMPAVGFY